MSPRTSFSKSLIVALEKVYAPLIQLASKLPAPLAYGLGALVAVLVAYILFAAFGSNMPNGLIWLIVVIEISALFAFVILDWSKRRASIVKNPSIEHIVSSSVFYVVVHERSDQTSGIADADVTLALPEPVTKRTARNGATNFTVPNEFIGHEFTLNARKDGYDSRNPIKVVLRRQGHEFISLEPIAQARQAHSPENVSVKDSLPHTATIPVVYDSNSEEKPFASWELFSDTRDNRIEIVTPGDFPPAFKLSAAGDGNVGANKSFRTLHGRVEFDYTVENSDSSGANIFFYMIPMQETGASRSGLIEVGTNAQGDRRNAFSPYRVRFLVPKRHYADRRWHQGTQEFDFRETPEAFYSIFGPRINEGSTHPELAVMLFTNVKLFSYEGLKEVS